MRTREDIASFPAAIPLVADDVRDFHLARLVLLFKNCGKDGKIDGLTKFAKLDFFVRYPEFFFRVVDKTSPQNATMVESSMVRHHYGPWDKRYYQLLSWLQATGLVNVEKIGKKIEISLSNDGLDVASMLEADSDYADLVNHMSEVKKKFGSTNGNTLKNLIYKVFDEEVALKKLGESI